MAVGEVEITLLGESWGSYPDMPREHGQEEQCGSLYIARQQGWVLAPSSLGGRANTKLASFPILIIRYRKNY